MADVQARLAADDGTSEVVLLAQRNLYEPQGPVRVPARLVRPHSLVEAAKASGLEDQYGRVATNRNQVAVQVATSKELRGRALRLAHALFTEAERRGYKVLSGRQGGADIVIGPTRASVVITERMTRSASPEKNRWGYEHCTHSPTGELRLELGRGARRKWNDGKRAKVEDHLHEVLAEVERTAVEDERRRLERERAERELTRRRREHLKGLEERVHHERRVEELVRQVEDHRQAQAIRAYADALATGVAGDRSPGSTREWAAFAREQADRVDPLNGEPGPPAHRRIDRERYARAAQADEVARGLDMHRDGVLFDLLWSLEREARARKADG